VRKGRGRGEKKKKECAKGVKRPIIQRATCCKKASGRTGKKRTQKKTILGQQRPMCCSVRGKKKKEKSIQTGKTGKNQERGERGGKSEVRKNGKKEKKPSESIDKESLSPKERRKNYREKKKAQDGQANAAKEGISRPTESRGPIK